MSFYKFKFHSCDNDVSQQEMTQKKKKHAKKHKKHKKHKRKHHKNKSDDEDAEEENDEDNVSVVVQYVKNINVNHAFIFSDEILDLFP